MNLSGNAAFTPGWPHNVTVYVNNILAYQYGNVNNSAFDHNITLNLTNNLSTISIYPTRIDVLSNTTGIINLVNLFYQDQVRNFTFNFYDEKDGSTFHLNRTNLTTLTIKCTNTSYSYPITSGTYKVGVPCYNFDFLKVEVTMNDQPLYYRTRVVSTNAGANPTIDWYLTNLYPPDPTYSQVVQIIIQLTDLNGRWQGSTTSITRYVNGTQAIIEEQRFDTEGKVYLYLTQGQQYNLTITNNYGEFYTSQFIADSAATKQLALPIQSYYPQNQYMEDNIRYYYIFNTTTCNIGFYYKDTSNLTTYAETNISYSTNNSVFYSHDYTGTDFVNGYTFLLTDCARIHKNESYTISWRVQNTYLGSFGGKQGVGIHETGLGHAGFTDNTWNKIMKYAIFIFLIVIMLSFEPQDSHYGLLVVFGMILVFKLLGWIDYWITIPAIVIIGIIAVLNWKRREDSSPT